MSSLIWDIVKVAEEMRGIESMPGSRRGELNPDLRLTKSPDVDYAGHQREKGFRWHGRPACAASRRNRQAVAAGVLGFRSRAELVAEATRAYLRDLHRMSPQEGRRESSRE